MSVFRSEEHRNEVRMPTAREDRTEKAELKNQREEKRACSKAEKNKMEKNKMKTIILFAGLLVGIALALFILLKKPEKLAAFLFNRRTIIALIIITLGIFWGITSKNS